MKLKKLLKVIAPNENIRIQTISEDDTRIYEAYRDKRTLAGATAQYIGIVDKTPMHLADMIVFEIITIEDEIVVTGGWR